MSIVHQTPPAVQPNAAWLDQEITDEFLDRLLAPFEDGMPVFGVPPWDSPMFSPDDAPGIPTMTFPAWIELQASAIRSHETDAARWLAGRLDELAHLARFLHATTPAEFDAREELAESDLLAREFDRGAEWSSPR